MSKKMKFELLFFIEIISDITWSIIIALSFAILVVNYGLAIDDYINVFLGILIIISATLSLGISTKLIIDKQFDLFD